MKKIDFDKLVDDHMQIALDEIGVIEPWFDEDVEAWVFEHPAYPESYGGESKEEVIERYPLYIRQFIEERLKGNLASFVEDCTTGRGGKRPGAGRPVGTIKAPTKRVSIASDLADWLKEDPSHELEAKELLMPSSYTVSHVANYFLQKAQKLGQKITHLKLQKLVYFAFGYYLASTNRKLFNEPILAWQFGPVVRSLYKEFQHFGDAEITSLATEFDTENFVFYEALIPPTDTNTLRVLDTVWEKYSSYSAARLVDLTHTKDSPWEVTHKRGESIIDSHLIKNFFKESRNVPL